MQNLEEVTQTGGSVVIPNSKIKTVRVPGGVGELHVFKSKVTGE